MSVCQGCGGELLPNRGPGRARKWCSERCRRTQYAGACVDCGAPTNGHDGPGRAKERCVPCSLRHQKESAYWTPEAIIGALQWWTEDENGGIPPTAGPWLRDGSPEGCPSVHTVQRVFGSWAAGLRAAGLSPFTRSHYGRDGEDLGLCQEIRERYEAGESSVDLGVDYGCSVNAIQYRIHKAGGRLLTHREVMLRYWANRKAAA